MQSWSAYIVACKNNLNRVLKYCNKYDKGRIYKHILFKHLAHAFCHFDESIQIYYIKRLHMSTLQNTIHLSMVHNIIYVYITHENQHFIFINTHVKAKYILHHFSVCNTYKQRSKYIMIIKMFSDYFTKPEIWLIFFVN